MSPEVRSAEALNAEIEVRELKSAISDTGRRIMGAALFTNLCLVSSLISVATGAGASGWVTTTLAVVGGGAAVRLILVRSRERRQLALLEASSLSSEAKGPATD